MSAPHTAPAPARPTPALRVAASAAEARAFVRSAAGDRAVGLALRPSPVPGDATTFVALAREPAAVSEGPTVAVWPMGRGDGEPLGELLTGAQAPYAVAHHTQDLLHILFDHGLAPPSSCGSTEIANVLLAQGQDHLAHELDAAVARGLGQSLQAPLAASAAGPHAAIATEADAVLATLRALTPRLRESGMAKLYDLECRLLVPVVDMERAGIGLNVAAFERIAADWHRERQDCQDPKRCTRLDKLLSTYSHWARDFVSPNGRIHCALHPLTADSGRFSCTDPNLQQVPSERTAPGLRGCFVPAPGYRFIIADYAQIELRVAAHLAPDERLRQVFLDGLDPHRATAASLRGKPEAEITDHERKLAKAVNFGFLFGMGAKRFQEYARRSYGLTLTDEEAARARATFFETFPGLAAWHGRTGGLSGRSKTEPITVRTVMGRAKTFPAGEFSWNAALNIPVQGTAAEGFKLAVIELHRRLPEVGGRGVLVVHDEYIAEVPDDRAEAARDLVESVMIAGMAAVVDSVPIAVEAEVAPCWR